MITSQIVISLGGGREKADFERISRRQEFPELRRHVAGDDAITLGIADNLHAKQVVEHGNDEFLHRRRVADGLIHLAQVGFNLLGLNGVLGEDAAGHLFPLRRLIDLAADVGLGLLRLGEAAEIQGELNRAAAFSGSLDGDATVRIEQQGLGDGVDDALRVLRKGDIDAGGPLDLPDLAQEDIKDDAIDGIIGAVQQAGFDLGRYLAVPIHPALPLFQSVRVPGQIVVQDTGEIPLQVNALA